MDFAHIRLNAINSANSRAKNTASKLYCFTSTLAVSAVYILSLAFAANELIKAHNSGHRSCSRWMSLCTDSFLLRINSRPVVGNQVQKEVCTTLEERS